MTQISGSNPFNRAQAQPAQFQQQQQRPPQEDNKEFAGLPNAFKNQMSQILGHQTDFLA